MSSSCDKSNCASCTENCSQRVVDMHEPCNPKSKIKHVISIISGKGGVGKSLVTSSLAVALNKKGYKVGVLDADITGPSIPKVFGLKEKAYGTEDGMYPMETPNGIKVMSVNLLLDDSEAPVIWRGPILGGVVKQFWTDVIWGELDFLLIDMPPGTGDVPLTVFQSIPLTGAVIVTSPQDLVGMIVKKSYYMAEKMNIHMFGIVENMSYMKCPDCGKVLYPFGEGKTETIAKEMGLQFLGKLPINPEVAAKCDAGALEEADISYMDETVEKLIGKVNQ
ncbi:MAG: Mrp/NBP35 family ATP-binding protein [Clostridiales bacterium]|nr:Mrp/NBP35 family ATP-binding protein [Clostridiales bacterium]